MATQPGDTEPTTTRVDDARVDASGVAAEVRTQEDRGARAIGSAHPLNEQTSPPGVPGWT